MPPNFPIGEALALALLEYQVQGHKALLNVRNEDSAKE